MRLKTLLRICIFILFFGSIISAIKFNNYVHGTYEVSFGIFGKLGEANMTIYKLPNNKYKMKVVAYATGFANTLSNGMIEEYESKGYIKANRFIPTSYYRKTTTHSGIKEYLYVFDYNKKNVTKNYKKTTQNKVYKEDDDGFGYYEDETKVQTDKDQLIFWAKEDLMSMFLNADIYIHTYKQDKVHNITAVGASEDQKGIIELLIPSKNAKKELLKDIKTTPEDIYLVIKIHKDIFNSDDGDLILSFNKDGIFRSALLQDVLIFGSIEGKLKNITIR